MPKHKIILITKKTDILEQLDNINCNLFVSETPLNNGYGCAWGDKDDSYKCYNWNCPLATSADLAHFRRLDNDLFEEWCEEFDLDIEETRKLPDEKIWEHDNNFSGGGWMHQYLEIVEIKGNIDRLKLHLKHIDEDNMDYLDDIFEFEIIENE